MPPPSQPLLLTATTLTFTILTSLYISRNLGPNADSSHSRTLKCKAKPQNPIYPIDTFPGGRTVRTPHGNLQVYEWGPADGERVVFLQGIGTPSVGYRELLEGFVERGYRVLTFDYFGRGHSDSPENIPHNVALYDHAILSALASSPISWPSFHLIGYSLGGGLAATFATYHPNLLASLTVISSGGLVRSENQLGFADRVLYGKVLPGWLARWWMGRRLRPESPGESVVEYQAGDEDKKQLPQWDDLVRWQMDNNEGFVESYLSTFQHVPIYDQHDTIWTTLGSILQQRRIPDNPHQGLPGGKITIFLGKTDPYVPVAEWMEDAERILGTEACRFHILDGGHEIGIQNGSEIAQLAAESWKSMTESE